MKVSFIRRFSVWAPAQSLAQTFLNHLTGFSMRLLTEFQNDLFTAKIADRLTFADHGQFRKLLDEVKTSGCRKVVFDLSDLSVVDSSGLGMLMIAIDDSKKAGWKLSVSGAQGSVLQLLQLSKLDQMLAA
jgi:anti-anti-sigma factor